MKEKMGDLSLSAELAGRLGPAPEALPNLAQQAVAPAPATQGDLDKLRRPDGRSRPLNRAWKDTAEYERQKGLMEERSRARNKRSLSQSGRPDVKRKSRSRSRPRIPNPEGSSATMEDLPEEKPVLKWIPGEREDYPVHLAEKQMHSFVNWAERYKLDERCEEVKALRYIVDHEMVVRKIIALIHWSLVYGCLNLHHPIPDRVAGLESVDRTSQRPSDAMFPLRFDQMHDLRPRARAEWENIASWVQYWFDALQLELRPGMLFGGKARLISPLVYFIHHHMNRVLELPIRMKEVLANTGWSHIRDHLEKFNSGALAEKARTGGDGGKSRREPEPVDGGGDGVNGPSEFRADTEAGA